MQHYTNKKTNEVYGYESIEDAKKYNDDFENLVEMTDEQFIQFRDHRPKGGVWTVDGWVVDPTILAEEEAQENQAKLDSLYTRLDQVERDIKILERFPDRDELEEQDLQALYKESRQIYREIQYLNTLKE